VKTVAKLPNSLGVVETCARTNASKKFAKLDEAIPTGIHFLSALITPTYYQEHHGLRYVWLP